MAPRPDGGFCRLRRLAGGPSTLQCGSARSYEAARPPYVENACDKP